MNGFDPTHEQMARDLMRGHAPDHQRGWSAQNSAMAVGEKFRLDEADVETLTIHGYGFRDGILLTLDPEASVLVPEEWGWTDAQHAAYERGLDRGRNETDPAAALISLDA